MSQQFYGYLQTPEKEREKLLNCKKIERDLKEELTPFRL